MAAATVQPLPPVTTADGRLGLDDVLAGSPAGQTTSWAQLAWNAGARVNRWEFRWDRIEPSKGTWNFTSDDAAVTSSTGAGLSIEGILIGTPAWATAAGQKPGNGLPRGLRLAPTDPRNLWAAYVRQTVAHYRGIVKYWEIWNEPDIASFWQSTPKEYFRLLKVAYMVIKSVDSSAQVLMAGMVAPDLGFVSSVLAAGRADPQSSSHHDFFDIFAWHAYGNAETLYGNLLRIQGLLANDGFAGKPIWVTESGFPAANPNGEPRQAAYVLQTALYAFAAGASRVLVYRASDDTTKKEWGLMAADGTPRMGYLAFQVAARYLSGVQSIVYAPTATMERFSLYSGQTRTTVMWTHGTSGQTVNLPIEGTQPTTIDWQGVTSTPPMSRGHVHLALPGAPYNAGIDPKGLVVGGEPVFLQETETLPTGLGAQQFIPPLAGTHRRVVLLNPSGHSISVVLTPSGRAHDRAVVQLAPHTVDIEDLDLLAGTDYVGTYLLNGTGAFTATALTDRGPIAAAVPGPTWYMAGVAPALTFHNAGTTAQRVTITALTASGKVRGRTHLTLAPSAREDWLPRWGNTSVSIRIHASGPVVVNRLPSDASGVPHPRKTWYLVHPPSSAITLFNPGSKGGQADVRYVGSKVVLEQRLRIQAHRTVRVPTHGANALMIAGTRDVVPGYESTGATVSLRPSTRAALTVAGSIRRVAVLNSSASPAHVSLDVVASTSHVHQLVVQPSHLAFLSARPPGAGPRGVLVKSDVPVVTSSVP